MGILQWDQAGERFYEAGVDRGVLYLSDGRGVAWNGLINVNEKTIGSGESPLYFDGVKYGDHIAPGDFAASIRAYTYPDEFLEFEGLADVGNGLYVANQMPKRFGLSYRTKVGNDTEGFELGYKIHILYNLIATPAPKNYQTTLDNSATEFEWNVTAVPVEIPGYRPSAHLIFDTRDTNPLLITDIENSLYGTELEDAKLPGIASLVNFIGNWVIIRITDNNDGTWTAEGPDNLISMLDATTFQIIQANAVYLDADTYMIGDSTH